MPRTAKAKDGKAVGYIKPHVRVTYTEAQAQALSDLATLLNGGSVSQPLITALNLVRSELAKVRRAHALVPAFARSGEEADAVVREVARESRRRRRTGDAPLPAGEPADKPTQRRIRAAERKAKAVPAG